MEKPAFYCDFCGAPVPRNASRCPACGRFFDAVKCPSCGFEGEVRLFKKGCPSCGYAGTPAARDTTPKGPPEKPDRPPRRISPRIYRLAIAALLTVLIVIFGLLVRRL